VALGLAAGAAAVTATGLTHHASAASTVGGQITRSEVLDRAALWVGKVHYLGDGWPSSAADPQGRQYRADCSGFVSMAWHASSTPSTPDFDATFGHFISKADLKPGDALLWPGSGGYGSDSGHVVLFAGWANNAQTSYHGYELAGGSYTAHHDIPYPYFGGDTRYLPFRYDNIVDDPAAGPPPIIGVLASNGDVVAKNGLGDYWTPEIGGIKQVAVAGTRVAVLGTDGRVQVKEGLTGAWHDVFDGARQVELSVSYIGVLANDGSVFAKAGINDNWTPEIGNVTQIALGGDRIGVLGTDGTVRVKSGLSGTWQPVFDGAKQVAVSDQFIGVLDSVGNVFAKAGTNDNWMPEIGDVTQIALGGDRIGVLGTDGNVKGKAGLNGGWLPEFDGAKQVAVSDSRIGVVADDGTAFVKDGMSDLWTSEYGGATQVVLS
jgi:hypothetical protein